MRKNWEVFIFDFDGVLVDSYSCLPSLYNYIARYIRFKNIVKKFVKRALEYEDEQDAIGNYNRKSWWPTLFKEFQVYEDEEKLDELLKIFHEERVKQTKIIKGAMDVLKWLRNMEETLIILAGSDGQPSMKKRRIEKSGLMKFFKDIFILGEDVKDRKGGIKSIIKKYSISESQAVFIDDKPVPINEIYINFKDITTIKIEFKGILNLAWKKEKCMPTYTIKTIAELRRIIDVQP